MMNRVFKILLFGLPVIVTMSCWGKMEGELYLPKLTTGEASYITATTATIVGNITDTGTPPYIERGVVYATTPNPTVGSLKEQSAGTGKIEGKGSFSVVVNGLTANTSYYARAYAANQIDVAYGEQIYFTTLERSATSAIDMVLVTGGTFTMGSNNSLDYYASPAHSVTLTQNYSIGKYQVTQGQWWAVMGSWPGPEPSSSYGAGDNYPMYYVNWDDIVGTPSSSDGYTINGITYYQDGFCYKLSQKAGDGKQYRLPTEAEWEFAARGGTKGKGYPFDVAYGYGPVNTYSGSDNIDEVAWYEGNNDPWGTKPVGGKLPNELGIYDMSGNVFEWCSDWYDDYTSGAQTNPLGPAEPSYSGAGRVFRGGSWYDVAPTARVAYRYYYNPDYRYYNIGFRIACSSQSSDDPTSPVLNTNAANNITATSATLGGNILIAGTPPYTERGVVYATTENPTTADSKKVISGSGTGDFSDEVTGLTAYTKYYVRAYVITPLGTFYGDEVTVTPFSIEMATVEKGTFQMGQEGVATPVHSVTLTQNYNIGKYQVTQGQWLAVMGEWPGTAPSSSDGVGNDYPAYYVSWNDIVGTSPSAVGYEINGITYYQNGFCYKLSQLAGGGKQYRLPTEAEWEFAARGGNTGKDNNHTYSGSDEIDEVAWYNGNNSPSGTKQVGGKLPNELGIYDMSGNVWEWCGDWYASYGSNAQTNPTGPESGSNRVYRGGYWDSNADYCRVAFRRNSSPDARNSNIGFRLVLP